MECPRGDSADGCASSLHSGVHGGRLGHVLACLVFIVRSIQLCYGTRQLQTSPANTVTVPKASTHSPNSSKQRSVLLRAAHGGTPCCRMWWGKKYVELESWANSLVLRLIHSELVYSELAVRCGDLDVNGGHPAVLSCEVMGVMEENCSVPSQCHLCIYLYTFHHRLQLETRYWATWILINLWVDILPPYFTHLTHPETVWDSDNKLKALEGLNCLIESVPEEALWGLPLTPVGFGSDLKYIGLPYINSFKTSPCCNT